MPGTLARLLDRLGRGNFHVLLIALLITVFLQSFAADSELIESVARIAVLVVVLAAVQVISQTNGTRTTGRVLTLLLICVQLSQWVLGRVDGQTSVPRLMLVQDALIVVAFGWILVILASALMRLPRVTAQALSASLCGYLMIGIWFFAVYMLLPSNAFHPLPETGASHHRTDLFYFSLVTLTSLGFGDVTPATPLTRSLAILEVVVGQFYIAVLIARQVGLYLAQRSDTETPDDLH